ncbi:MAG TPA: hypothetical protein VE591_11600, partial [Candidatus Acidoferrum sp.]|nr:hypothetical protein [Candidatus Acidoferrum sp.]
MAFRITIPARSTSGSGRSPRYVSASTQSIVIVVNGGAKQVVDLSANASNCSNTSSGRTCSVPITAPTGPDTFDFTAYDQSNGTGNILSHSSVPQTITPGVANTVNVTLGGTVAS